LLNENLYLNVNEDEEIKIVKHDQFERNGFLAYLTYFAYSIGLYDVVSGKVNMNYMTIFTILLGSLGYSGRRSFSLLNDAYNFYGTVNKMATQYRQREILIQTRTVEKRIEEIPEGEETSLEVTPAIQSNSKQALNQSKKSKNV